VKNTRKRRFKMRRLIILAFAILFATTSFFTGCALPQSLAHGSKIDYITIPSPSIEYESYNYLLGELEKEAEVQMFTESQRTQKRNDIPLGGEIIVHICELTIGAANTKYFTVIVEENGKEIIRENGRDNIPEVPRSPGGCWWNLMIVYIDKSVEHPLKVYVIDELSNKRYEYTITPDHLLPKSSGTAKEFPGQIEDEID
jgi:hypothetical protein